MTASEMVESTVSTLCAALSALGEVIVDTFAAVGKAVAAILATFAPAQADVEDAEDVVIRARAAVSAGRIGAARSGHASAFLVAPLAGPAATRAP